MFEAINFLEINEDVTNNGEFGNIVFVDVHFKANYKSSEKVMRIGIKEEDGTLSITEADGSFSVVNSVSLYFKCHEWTNSINVEDDPEGICEVEVEAFISFLGVFVRSYINQKARRTSNEAD